MKNQSEANPVRSQQGISRKSHGATKSIQSMINNSNLDISRNISVKNINQNMSDSSESSSLSSNSPENKIIEEDKNLGF